MTHPHPKGNVVPKAVLMKYGNKTLNTDGQNFLKAAVSVNTARPIYIAYPRPTVNNARTTSNVFNRAHTHVRRPFNKSITNKNSNLKEKVNTVKGDVTTAGPKAVVTDNKGNEANAETSPTSQIMKKLMVDLFPLEEIPKEVKSLVKVKSVQGTLQQNGVAERKNKTPIEAAKTMLADSKLPITFWAEAVNTACYVQNRVCPVTILNTIDHLYALTKSMNYKPVVAGNQSNGNEGIKACDDAGKVRVETVPITYYILLPLWTQDLLFSSSSKDSFDAGFKPSGEEEKIDYEHQENEDNEVPNTEKPRVNQEGCHEQFGYKCACQSYPTIRVHKDHPLEQIIRDIHSAPQTRRMTKNVTEHVEPKKVIQALTDPSWIEAMQDELLQFKLQKVWTLVDLPYGKRAIGTKWVYINKKGDRGIVVRNKARLVVQGYTQEEGIDYDKVFSPVARIEAIRLFFAYASFMGFIVYQMDVKSAFLYGTIEEEVAWYETLSTYLLENGFLRGTINKTLFIKKDKGDILLVQVYVDDIIFGSTKKSLCVEFEQMMHKRFQMSSMGELTFFLGLQVKQKDDGIFISQDKYVADILKKFDFVTVKTTSTPIETNKALLKDEEAEDVDVHLYRSMIGSLMYLTASRPDIMFAVCACARFQVTPKVSHLHAVKRIFRYLKGHT
ncbi:putative ribonuclease H-like domain-containing protein [Tanacetum coccineum]|uniref:Ribonuclease H-like domain-containing protein n=1 Tax=Tanacetum coccineum TaxID=301880 RepID=A0ABQ5FFG7_9ASTR